MTKFSLTVVISWTSVIVIMGAITALIGAAYVFNAIIPKP